MTKKIYKLFGIKIFEIQEFKINQGDIQVATPFFSRKPQGAILNYTPEDEQRDLEKAKMRK